ncbi:hypothetical protein VCRA2110O318_150026 [Vibrio crassostreae]|nr:hypothetical protein VCRA2117O328_150076 [Vibrio crassostreae]CAK2276138.1 hypothetical protein VCRA2110O318_150026 [Vibrio crassostreae]CAK2412825.1 hypothetical protein VCRA2110O319_140076 [Vibrio crassostreae]CAK2645953.1 hypothetical protein VCRA217O317_150027 [Vibrio crassostreae]
MNAHNLLHSIPRRTTFVSFLKWCMLMMLALLLVACGGDGDPVLPGGDGTDDQNGGNGITATMTAIEAHAQYPTMLPGLEQPLEATALFDVEGASLDVSDKVSWSSTDESVVSVANGIATAQGQGTATLTATLNDLSAVMDISVVDASAAVTSVNIVEPKIDIPLNSGYSLNVEVTYIDLDGFARTTDMPLVLNWQSTDETIVAVSDDGEVSGLQEDAVGQTITASLSGISDTVTVTVTDKALTSLEVKPNNTDLPLVGMSQQMQAVAHFDDMTTLDVTSQASWDDDDTSNQILTLSEQGLATAVADGGPVTITGEYDGQSASADMTVGNTNVSVTQINLLPVDLDITKGLTERYQAIAMLDDNSTVDVTSLVKWNVEKDSAGKEVARFGAGDNDGVLSAIEKSTNTVNVMAELNGLDALGTLDVLDARLKSLNINPSLKRTAAVALPFEYAVEGVFTDDSKADVTDLTTFTSSDPAVVTFIGGKYAKPVAPGVATITASSTVGGVTQTAEALYEVTDVDLSLQKLRVEPSSLTLPMGDSAPVQVIGTLNTLDEHDVTSLIPHTNWTSNASNVAYKATGDTYTIATGDTQGTTNLKVTADGITASLSVTTTAAALESITLSPVSQTLSQGMSHVYIATGHYTDGTTATLDNSADLDWTSSDAGVTVMNGVVSVTATAPGTAVSIEATDKQGSGIAGHAVVHVIPASVTQLDITPLTETTVVGGQKAMTATATLSNGNTLDVSSLVDWTVDSSYLSVDSKGVITGVAETTPTTLVGASIPNGGLDAVQEAEVTVDAATLINMSVLPNNVTLAKGLTKQYIAYGSTSDGQNMEVDVDWSTGDNLIADIDTAGLLTAVGVGATTVTATDPDTGLTDTVAITVSGAQVDPSSLTLSPSTITVQEGKIAPTTAEVTLTDGTTVVDVTDNIGLNVTPGSGSAQGLADGWLRGITAGDATATASLETMVSNTIDIDVTPSVQLASIDVAPATQDIEESTVGQPLVVTARYDDNSTLDVSTLATFTDPNTYVTFTDNVPTAGTTIGSTTVDVSYTEGSTTVTATADINVTAATPPVDRIEITPNGQVIEINTEGAMPYTVNAYYSSDPTTPVDVTNDPATSITFDGTYVVAFDKATGRATAGGTVSDAHNTGYLEANYGGKVTRVDGHVSAGAPPDACNTKGIRSVAVGKYRMSCPLTVAEADARGISYTDSVSANGMMYATNASSQDHSSGTIADYCDQLNAEVYEGESNWMVMDEAEMKGVSVEGNNHDAVPADGFSEFDRNEIISHVQDARGSCVSFPGMSYEHTYIWRDASGEFGVTYEHENDTGACSSQQENATKFMCVSVSP